ncbi:MAG: HIT domain-containing protein [Alphaproteobacteria bacterium]|nr:HIT domain-containing protein [Alphaproteobacteria bacterium]
MPYDDNNVFAKILRGEIPSKKVHESEHALAFHDIRPAKPVHVLVIPKGKYVDFTDFTARASAAEQTGFYKAVAAAAKAAGVVDAGYRLIANTGMNGGQEVPHFHIHILGGGSVGPMVARG